VKRELLMRKVGPSLRPDGEAAWEVFDTIRTNKAVVVTVDQPRNPEQLRDYWVMAQIAADHSDEFEDKDDADHFARTSTPWMRKEYETRERDGTLKVRIRPKSIAIGSMPQEEFDRFYQRAIELWSQKIGADVQAMMRELYERKRRDRAPAV